jgi:hypothetical protein
MVGATHAEPLDAKAVDGWDSHRLFL